MPEAVPPLDPEAYVSVTARFLGLKLDDAWLAPVSANLRVLSAAGALLTEFPIPDEVEAAPRFEA